MQHLTEVLVAGRIVPGTTSAHRRGPGTKPACMPSSAANAGWVELSAGRALKLGAVPCTEPACIEAVA
jgi:hypothetical protein